MEAELAIYIYEIWVHFDNSARMHFRLHPTGHATPQRGGGEGEAIQYIPTHTHTINKSIYQ